MNQNPKCEPHLSKYGLYDVLGNTVRHSTGGEYVENLYSLLWVLNLSDGNHSLKKISEMSGYDISRIKYVTSLLEEKTLLKKITNSE